MSNRDDKKGGYRVSTGRIPHSVTKVGTGQSGIPNPIRNDQTPIQPIVIQVPQQHPPKSGHVEVWHLIVAIVASIVLSGSIAFYIAASFLDEATHKIDKIERKVDQLDTQSREFDSRLTRIEAQVGNYHGN